MISSDAFRIGDRLVQPALNRIDGPASSERVEPKVMQVLLCLAEQPGEPVTRERLLDRVWPEVVVTDDVLTRSISELRKAFDDDARRPQIIETIPKVGYRLVAPVDFTARGDTAPPAVPVPSVAPTPPPLPAAAPRRVWLVLGGALMGLAALLAYALIVRPTVPPPPPVAPQPVPFTTMPGIENRPAFSPDGTRIAFSHRAEGSDQWDVFVKLTGAESVLQLTDSPEIESSPAWSADGRFVLYIRYPPEGGCDLYRTPALGGAAQRIGSCGQNIYPDLAAAPDGARLAFGDRTTATQPYGIHLLDPASGAVQRLTDPPMGVWGDHDPAFSPDGRHIAFTRSRSEGQQDLYVVAVAGGEPVRLTSDNRNIKGLTWAADGRHVLFASNRNGRALLWRVPASGGEPAWVPLGDQGIGFPDVMGARLVYEQQTTDANLWRIERGPDGAVAAPVQVASSTRWDLHPQLSPDGARLAFTSNRNGRYEVWASDADGGRAAPLTRFDGPFTGTPRWSPDGRTLVFDSRPDGHADLFVIDAGGGAPRRLTTDPADDLAASWSRDGQRLFFTSNRDGAWQVWSMPAGGGEATRVTGHGGYGPQPSPDGAWLYYAKPDTAGLWRRPAPGGPEEQVLDDLDPRLWGSWAVTDDGLVYVRRAAGTLAFFDLATRQATDLLTLPGPVPLLDPALTASSDGRVVILGQTDRITSDLMLVEDVR